MIQSVVSLYCLVCPPTDLHHVMFTPELARRAGRLGSSPEREETNPAGLKLVRRAAR